MSITVTTDTRAFIAAVDRMMKQSKRTRGEVMKTQAKGILRTIISLTPPSNGQKTGGDARKAGELTLQNDLKKVFTVASAQQISAQIEAMGGKRELSAKFGHAGAKALGNVTTKVLSQAEMKSWHQSHRNRGTGRAITVRNGAATTTGLRKRDLKGLDQGLVTAQAFAAYFKEAKQRVGYLVSGWAVTAEKLGVPMSAWMKRNRAPGQAEILITDVGVKLTSTNAAAFAGNVKDMARRIDWALKSQKGKIERQIENYEKRLHRQTGLAR